jgi:hypothetical protein
MAIQPIFPTLSSGAVAQYPLPISYTSPVDIIRFIDAADQRFMARGKTLRAWHLQLSFLNEDELAQIAQFFEALEGQYSLFGFPDPYGGQTVPNCRMGESSLVTDYLSVDLTSSSFWVVESNG